jgi:hypothetical protein
LKTGAGQGSMVLPLKIFALKIKAITGGKAGL